MQPDIEVSRQKHECHPERCQEIQQRALPEIKKSIQERRTFHDDQPALNGVFIIVLF